MTMAVVEEIFPFVFLVVGLCKEVCFQTVERERECVCVLCSYFYFNQ